MRALSRENLVFSRVCSDLRVLRSESHRGH